MLDKKIAFIYGNTDDNRGIKEGQIEMIGDAHDEDELHIKCIMDYIGHFYSSLLYYNLRIWFLNTENNYRNYMSNLN